MSRSPFDPDYEELPDVLPIFPLGEVLLLPGGRLPLNIFEPRYLAMCDDALAGHRMIGMIQPTEQETQDRPPEVYETGCAGRIVSFSETEDGRYLITLAGLIRFDVRAELPSKSYRLAEPDYERFKDDLEEDASDIDRDHLLEVLREYFTAHSIEGDWSVITQASNEGLVTALAMICPLGAPEKQALLEAMTLTERAETLTAIMEMSLHSESGDTLRH